VDYLVPQRDVKDYDEERSSVAECVPRPGRNGPLGDEPRRNCGPFAFPVFNTGKNNEQDAKDDK